MNVRKKRRRLQWVGKRGDRRGSRVDHSSTLGNLPEDRVLDLVGRDSGPVKCLDILSFLVCRSRCAEVGRGSVVVGSSLGLWGSGITKGRRSSIAKPCADGAIAVTAGRTDVAKTSLKAHEGRGCSHWRLWWRRC